MYQCLLDVGLFYRLLLMLHVDENALLTSFRVKKLKIKMKIFRSQRFMNILANLKKMDVCECVCVHVGIQIFGPRFRTQKLPHLNETNIFE